MKLVRSASTPESNPDAADPHAILGLSPGATQEQIRAAFRGLAARYHPDRNPNDPVAARRYAAIVGAYEILQGKGPPDQKRVAALAVLSECLAAILLQCAEKGHDPSKLDLAAAMKSGFDQALSQHESALAKLKKQHKVATKALGRFRKRKGVGGDNLLEHLLGQRLEDSNRQIENCQAVLDATAEAKRLLAEYEYGFDRAAVQVLKMASTASTASGWMTW